MRPAGPHIAVVVDSANKASELALVFGRFHFQDGIYLLFPSFQASRREPVPEPVRFLDGPFAF